MRAAGKGKGVPCRTAQAKVLAPKQLNIYTCIHIKRHMHVYVHVIWENLPPGSLKEDIGFPALRPAPPPPPVLEVLDSFSG